MSEHSEDFERAETRRERVTHLQALLRSEGFAILADHLSNERERQKDIACNPRTDDRDRYSAAVAQELFGEAIDWPDAEIRRLIAEK